MTPLTRDHIDKSSLQDLASYAQKKLTSMQRGLTVGVLAGSKPWMPLPLWLLDLNTKVDKPSSPLIWRHRMAAQLLYSTSL